MMVHLKHPEHGYKIAYDRIEYEQDLRTGWKEYDVKERDRIIAEKIKAQSPLGVSTSVDAGNVSETGQETSQKTVERVKRKYTRRQEVSE